MVYIFDYNLNDEMLRFLSVQIIKFDYSSCRVKSENSTTVHIRQLMEKPWKANLLFVACFYSLQQILYLTLWVMLLLMLWEAAGDWMAVTSESNLSGYFEATVDGDKGS